MAWHDHQVGPDELLSAVQVDLRPRVGRDLAVHALLEGHPKVRTQDEGVGEMMWGDGEKDACMHTHTLIRHPPPPREQVHVLPPSDPQGQGPCLYQYRAKYEIKNRGQLLGWLERYNQVRGGGGRGDWVA